MFSIRDCGLLIEPQQGMSVEEILDCALYAEKSGYGYIFRSDHMLPIRIPMSGVASPECWVSLGALAARTSKINFGPMVSPVGFRNPAMLGRMACTIHSFSRGRLLLGLGAGWYSEEYAAHGIIFPDFKTRRNELLEAFEIIRPMTEGRRVDFDGQYFSAHVDCYPRPYRGKVSLIGGGRNPLIVRALAKYVDEWNIFNTPLDSFLKLKDDLEKTVQRSKNIQISMMVAFLISETKRGLEERKKSYMRAMGLPGDPSSTAWRIASKGILCGTPEDFVEQILERRKAGIEKFYFQLADHKDAKMLGLLTRSLKEKL